MNRVLVVEDDDRQRNMICLILANAGYGIVEAVSVKTALMHLDIIDLSGIVLDLRLPNGHGKKVIDELVAKRDDVPVVVLTGYPEDAKSWNGFPVTAVISKPFKRAKLLEAVADARIASDAIKSMRSSTRKLGEKLPPN